MNNNKKFNNFDGISANEIDTILKKTDQINIGTDHPDHPIDFFQYKDKKFQDLFGKENISNDFKEKIVKKLENDILKLKKKLIEIEKVAEKSFYNQHDEELFQYLIDIEDISNQIKNRENKIVIIICSN